MLLELQHRLLEGALQVDVAHEAERDLAHVPRASMALRLERRVERAQLPRARRR